MSTLKDEIRRTEESTASIISITNAEISSISLNATSLTGSDAYRRANEEDEEASIKSDDETEPTQTTKQPWREIFMLSFTSLGAIYGDIGTSPLYVLNSIKYSEYPPNKDDVYGGISIIFYLFTIIVIFKYIMIVLVLGPNNGEGGQVAIYAKIARYLNIGPKGVHIPGAPEVSDMELLQRQDTTSSFRSSRTTKSLVEDVKTHPLMIKCVQKFILFACFLGCSLVISDGLLTPTTSVLSAVAGIQIAQPSFDNVLAVAEVILICLFLIQQFGSHKVSFLFAPVIFIWLVGLIICGIYNIAKFHPGIFRALSPYYAIKILKNGGIDVFSGAMLSITGTEAMFADIGHFGRLPIQLTLTCLVYPALIICYLGQGAYIVTHPEAYTSPFFLSLPGGTGSGPYWVMFVLSTLATIIASQALILSVFSIVSQLINLDCFPNVKIVHTSKDYAGKVYIPAVNWLLMIGVCCTTAGFKTSNNVTAAYGLGITLDFLVTSCLIALCMVYVYSWNILWAVLFITFFIPLEVIMVVSNLKKVVHGAWFPIMMAGLVFIFLSIWRWGQSRKVDYEFKQRVRIADVYPLFRKEPQIVDLNLGGNRPENNESLEVEETHIQEDKQIKVSSRFGISNLSTHDGIAILYNDSSIHNFNSPNTLPQVYAKIIDSFVSIPSIFIFCSTRTLSIPYVPNDERVLIASTRIPGHYKCIVRFGFMEEIIINHELSATILESVPEIAELMTRFNDNHQPQERLEKPDSLPTVHIFENNLLRCHDYTSEEYKTKNPLTIVGRILRKITINHFYSPLVSITRQHGQFLKLHTEEEETNQKLFIGGIARI
ncbi:high affinity potassium transporter [Suhomyces tanzawaensis NRRL Y-17324]|uniref:High affinity potassium transporter n=1 Tax=Suhomyces tanzawaensis NRRL Y-17324 TaxID=984487 RepID=A0A1E4SGG8_9ASCO|nr:high affinity potassium transporter [Suhomyces tanzawaensis NRRL Y-17324]ODV78607.1 high affinity potassium transporter [Suhomyces tanzawaensis NRRL Y-17324]